MDSQNLHNNKGIALLTALMMTFISLTIVMAVMYMVTQSIQQGGQTKRYRTALEASYGGADALVKQVLPVIIDSSFKSDFTLFSVSYPNDANCSVAAKLTLSSNEWATLCDQSPEPNKSPDITFQLPASAGGQSYTVYSKIIDTLVGNTDMSAGGGGDALAGGVVEAGGGGGIDVKHIPYVYRLEVQAERTVGATEQANITVLYAY